MQKKIRSGGFVFVEFAIALPLLILLLCGLGKVSIEIFRLGRDQLADYVLESEAQYVMEKITQEARAARIIEVDNTLHKIKIIYHAVDDNNELLEFNGGSEDVYYLFSDKDIWETRFFFHLKNKEAVKLYAKRNDDGRYNTPTTGENSFGETQITSLTYALDEEKKILHIELEMESLETRHKIKIATAVFVPGLENNL